MGNVVASSGVVSLVIAMWCGCDGGDNAPPDAAPDASADPGSCTSFLELETRWWRQTLPYIEPTSGMRIYVAGADFISLWGQSDPQSDNTTLVWAPKRFHYEDGVVQLGAVGNRSPTDTRCEWVVPVRVE